MKKTKIILRKNLKEFSDLAKIQKINLWKSEDFKKYCKNGGFLYDLIDIFKNSVVGFVCYRKNKKDKMIYIDKICGVDAEDIDKLIKFSKSKINKMFVDINIIVEENDNDLIKLLKKDFKSKYDKKIEKIVFYGEKNGIAKT